MHNDAYSDRSASCQHEGKTSCEQANRPKATSYQTSGSVVAGRAIGAKLSSAKSVADRPTVRKTKVRCNSTVPQQVARQSRSKGHDHEHQSRRKSENTHQNTHRAFHSHKDAMHAQGGVLVIDDPRIYSHITSMATWKCFGVCPHSSPFPSTTEILNHMVASHQQNSEITFDEVIANELKGQHIQEESTTQHCNNKRSLRNVRNAFFPFPREQSQHEMCAEAARHVEKRRVWMSMSNPM
jgi:hypothetical protein